MRRWWLGFIGGVVFHWLIALLFCFIGEEEMFVLALSRNFQFTFLSVTTLLWGILGGAIFALWAYLSKMKKKELTRRYFASLGFLVGSVGLGVPLLLLGLVPEKFSLSILKPFFSLIAILSLPVALTFPLLTNTLRSIGFRGLTDEIIAPFVGVLMLLEFLLFAYWGIIGSIIGYRLGLFKEKQTLKRSGKDEAKG